MKVSREQARQAVVKRIQTLLPVDWPEDRIRWPGQGPIDTAITKTPYINVDMVYNDGISVGMGPSPQRRIGTLVVEVNFKEGEPKDLIKANNVLDAISFGITDTDAMKPVRTFASKFVSPKNGVESGWMREGLVTPFYFDTSR